MRRRRAKARKHGLSSSPSATASEDGYDFDHCDIHAEMQKGAEASAAEDEKMKHQVRRVVWGGVHVGRRVVLWIHEHPPAATCTNQPESWLL